jgi:GTP-binding protein EngB required for normal cell division
MEQGHIILLGNTQVGKSTLIETAAKLNNLVVVKQNFYRNFSQE